VPAYQQTWPSTRSVANAVTIRFVCGYASAAAVPFSMLAAIKLLVGHWYSNRESSVVGATVQTIPQGVDSLIWQSKVWA